MDQSITAIREKLEILEQALISLEEAVVEPLDKKESRLNTLCAHWLLFLREYAR